MWIRFSRFRFKEGREPEGLEILRQHATKIGGAKGCERVWVGQGEHPSTEFVVIALFETADDARRLEARMRSDPAFGGDFFGLLRLTTQPPEVTEYEVRLHERRP